MIFMKIRNCIVILLLLMFILGCEEPRYDTLDFNSSNVNIELEEPVNLTVQGSNNYIMIYWNYPLNQTVTVSFAVYRSESENGEFALLKDEINSTYYYDNAVEPGKTYWYKVKAKSILYGDSDFSESKSAVRKGRGVDIYDKEAGNDKKENSTKIEYDTVYKSSLYISHDATTDDCDYYTIDAKKGDILEITLAMATDENVASLSSYDILITSELKDIFSKTGEMLSYPGNLYRISFSRDTPIYIKVSADSTPGLIYKTGDYDLMVSKKDSSDLFLSYSTSYVSYIKVSWSSFFSQGASKYTVQRRETGTEEWANITAALSPYRVDVHEEFSPSVATVYDRSAQFGKSYDYRVVAHLETSYKVDGETQEYKVDFYSSVTEDVKIYENKPNNLPKDAEDNIDFDNALEIELEKQVNAAIDTADCRFYKVKLEAGKTYSFSIYPYSSSGKVLFSVDFYTSDDNGKKKLLCIPPQETAMDYGSFSYTTEKNDEDSDKDYWLCIDGNNTLGQFSVLVKEDKS